MTVAASTVGDSVDESRDSTCDDAPAGTMCGATLPSRSVWCASGQLGTALGPAPAAGPAAPSATMGAVPTASEAGGMSQGVSTVVGVGYALLAAGIDGVAAEIIGVAVGVGPVEAMVPCGRSAAPSPPRDAGVAVETSASSAKSASSAGDAWGGAPAGRPAATATPTGERMSARVVDAPAGSIGESAWVSTVTMAVAGWSGVVGVSVVPVELRATAMIGVRVAVPVVAVALAETTEVQVPI